VTVIDLDAWRPHITIMTADGNGHVIPKAVFEKIVSGECSFMDVFSTDREAELVMRAIISDWLKL